MVTRKTAALNIRINPDLKEAIRIAAIRDNRSIANMVETLIIQHCQKTGISIPQQQALQDESDDASSMKSGLLPAVALSASVAC